MNFFPIRKASFASLGPFSSYFLLSTITVLLAPNFLANFSACCLPTSSASIQRYILSNFSKNGSKDIGKLWAPLGKLTDGIPVSWYTAIASNSPSVITIVLSVSFTVVSPNRPYIWLPIGYIFCLLLLSLPMALHFIFMSSHWSEFISLSASYSYFNSLYLRLPDGISFFVYCYAFLDFGIYNGKYTESKLAIWSLSFLNRSLPTPTLKVLSVFFFNHLCS